MGMLSGPLRDTALRRRLKPESATIARARRSEGVQPLVRKPVTPIGTASVRSIAGSLLAAAAAMTFVAACNPVAVGVAVGSDAAMLGAANWGDVGVGYRSVQKNYPSERGVDVSLYPYNWKAARDPKYFSVGVDFSSDPTTRRNIDADFRQFALSMPDGEVVRPVGYALTYPDVVSQGCRNGTGATSLPPSEPRTIYSIHSFPDTPIRVRSNSWARLSECYDVIFPVATLAPESAFSVNVAGVSIDGRPMREEKVLFAPGPGR